MPRAERPERLGKVERFLLTFMVRPSYASYLPAYSVHARSCALQTYYREVNAISGRNRRNVARVLRPREYNSLQVTFTKALQRLEQKGLVQVARGGGRMWSAEKQLFFGSGGEELAYFMGIRMKPLQPHVCCRHYPVIYRLTKRGVSMAEELAFGRGSELSVNLLS